MLLQEDIAAIFSTPDGFPPEGVKYKAGLRIPFNNSRFIDLKPESPMCDPICYPLLFPLGEQGWHDLELKSTAKRPGQGINAVHDENEDIPVDELEPQHGDDQDEDGTAKRTRLTLKISMLTALHIVLEFSTHAMKGGSLTQQWIVDSMLKIEMNRLNFYKKNQKEMRVAQYSGLHNYIRSIAENTIANVGAS